VQKIQESSGVTKDIHLRLGQICLRQRLYQQACKSFTVGGDRLKAMTALLKSGDKDKIVMFANVSKHPDIFKVAANFLQTLNWSSDMLVMRTIIQFYTKAKAFDSLSRFYENCAQVEIDEYQNYEKALEAITEAVIAIEKSSSAATETLICKQNLIGLFINAQRYGNERQVERCEDICSELLNQTDIDSVIRIGDIFGLLIEVNFKVGNQQKAFELLQRLKMRLPKTLTAEYYVDETICRSLEGGESKAEIEIEENII
jgi:intraflagellar transport protein 140